MKGKSFGSNCVYPSIFKEYFLEAINESGYKNKAVYKDLDNLSLNLSCIKVNMYSVNIFLSNVFRHYKKVKFNVLQVRKIYHVKDYQLYHAKISINYKGSMWLMDLSVGNTLSNFPNKRKEIYLLPNLKRKVEIHTYSNEEKIADLFYRITINLNANAIDLYNLYLMYYGKINISDLGLALEHLYKSISYKIDYDSIDAKIKSLSANRKQKEKWLLFKYINSSIMIEYEDIICCLYLLLLKLKEREEKKPLKA